MKSILPRHARDHLPAGSDPLTLTDYRMPYIYRSALVTIPSLVGTPIDFSAGGYIGEEIFDPYGADDPLFDYEDSGMSTPAGSIRIDSGSARFQGLYAFYHNVDWSLTRTQEYNYGRATTFTGDGGGGRGGAPGGVAPAQAATYGLAGGRFFLGATNTRDLMTLRNDSSGSDLFCNVEAVHENSVSVDILAEYLVVRLSDI